MNVSIIGAGYVGLVTGVCLAEKKHHVTCVDIDKEKVKKISDGVSPIFENGLEDLLKKNISNKNFTATTNLKKAVRASEISIVAVDVPLVNNKVEFKYLRNAVKDIGIALKKLNGYHVIVVKSTVPPGTTDDVVLPILEEYSDKKSGVDFGVSANPEFLREGCAVSDFLKPDRIVIGGIDKKTTEKIVELYKPFDGDVLVTNNKTAEMIKYVSNALLATLISFSNEIANICAMTENVDVKEVMAGVHLDRRLNPRIPGGGRVNPEILSYLEAGCGFGGSCLPKDIETLINYCVGADSSCKCGLLKSVAEVNREQPKKLLQLLRKHNGSLENSIVAVLGLAFKPNTDDVRGSPAIPVIRSLRRKRACIKAYDPLAQKNARKILGTIGILYPESLEETLIDVDAVILITPWEEFRELHILINKLESPPLIIDGRRMLDKSKYKRYVGIGLNDANVCMKNGEPYGCC